MEEIKIQIRSAHAHWVRKIMWLIIIFRKRSGFLPVPARRRSVDAKYIVKAKACEAGICHLSAGDGTASSKYLPDSLFKNQMSLFSICDGMTFISRDGIHLEAARDFFSLARPGVTFLAHLRCLK